LERPLKVLPSVTGVPGTTAYTVRGKRGSDLREFLDYPRKNKRKQRKR
jgi:hypothetical protein